MNKDNVVEVNFTKLGHFWLDSGLVGLIKFLPSTENVKINVSENGLSISGKPEDIQSLLEKTYDIFVGKYYNTSTLKQRQDTSSYNFYYDSQTDNFISFPKRKTAGIASLIYNKAPRPTGDSIKWEKKEKRDITYNGKTVKKNRAILPHKLPKEYKHLEVKIEEIQKRMDLFLDSNGLDVTTSGLLIDGPNAIKPKINIKIEKNSKEEKGYCYLCGKPSSHLEEINQTVFPLITGTSGLLSFNSEAGKPEKVCWKCALLGKFVPANGFYLTQGENIYCFFPYSVSLERMCTSYDVFQDIKYDDPNLFKNFEHPLGAYFQHPYEVTFAFLYTLYDKLLLRNTTFSQDEKSEIILDLENLLDITINRTPLEFYVVHARNEGDTYGFKMVWPFKDTVYFFRLMEQIERITGYRMKEIMTYLVDYSQDKNEAKTFLRNRFCERILKKLTVLDLVEHHVFSTGITYFKPLFEMLIIYEQIIREGNKVFPEEQEVAVTLGKRIGVAAAKSKNGKKGDLFALRRTRRKIDFLEQLNRLQFKFDSDFVVPADVYDGKLTDENFQEFKQFCLISALNSYNAIMNPRSSENK